MTEKERMKDEETENALHTSTQKGPEKHALQSTIEYTASTIHKKHLLLPCILGDSRQSNTATEKSTKERNKNDNRVNKSGNRHVGLRKEG